MVPPQSLLLFRRGRGHGHGHGYGYIMVGCGHGHVMRLFMSLRWLALTHQGVSHHHGVQRHHHLPLEHRRFCHSQSHLTTHYTVFRPLSHNVL